MITEPRIALVQDWMTRRGGSERVLYELHKMWPEAPIYTAIYEPKNFPEFADADVRTTWLNKVKLARTKHQLFSIPRAWAYKGIDLSEYDIVISSSSAESKYVTTGPNTLHICYCHTPIRYYWSDYDWYRKHPPFSGPLNLLAKVVLPMLLPLLRRQDYGMAQRVDRFVANSATVQARIKKYYNRDSTVIYPPVDVGRFGAVKRGEGEYYLIAGRQVAYRRLDLAVDAFNKLGLPLVVAGTGEEVPKQQSRARDNIEFRGFVPEQDLAELYANAKALIYPQLEDFGIIPVEAGAAGTPVIAYGVGGGAESVLDGKTGVLFNEQTAEALVGAVKRFQTLIFDPQVLRQNAQRFDQAVFDRDMRAFVKKVYSEFKREGTK